MSNYGFKMYALNEKNEYTVALLEWYYDDLETIIELDKNSFIFCSRINIKASLSGPPCNELIIEKIDLRAITKEEIKKKLIEKDEDEDEDKIDDEKAKKVIESLKFTYAHKKFIEYSIREEYHYFKGTGY